jgi:protein-disulfide isomerase
LSVDDEKWYYIIQTILFFKYLYMQEKTNPSLLSEMSPAHVFIFGIVQGILVLCTIGFFIMIGVYFSGVSGDIDLYDSNGSGDNTAPVVQPAADPVAAAPVEVKEVDKNDHIRGDKNAPITLMIYSDFECPFCSRFNPTVDQVLEEYDGQVRIVYRHFPLRSIHADAAPAAAAAECASEQGKFWEFHDELFANQASLGDSLYNDIATRLGMNVSTFKKCVSSDKRVADVQEDEVSAQKAGARGTPYSVVISPDGEAMPLSGAVPFTSVKPIIDQMLAS